MSEEKPKIVPLLQPLKHPESGEICWHPGFCKQETFDSAMRYKAREDDIFVTSFAKSGTTWLQHIVWLITHFGMEYFEGMGQSQCIPMLEFEGEENTANIDTRGYQKIIKTHFPYKWTPKNDKALYLYIARDPKDVLVSYYYHIKGFPGYQAPEFEISTLYDMFMRGEVEFNDHCEHVAEWYKHKDDKNVLFLLYEDLQEDLEREVVKIAKFLGRDYWSRLQENDNQLLKEVVEKATFKSMSKGSSKKWVKADRPKELPFVRKGVTGDYKNHLTKEQIDGLNKKLRDQGAASGIDKLWNTQG